MNMQKILKIPVDSFWLEADLEKNSDAEGLILFAHGSGSSRHSPRNRYVAEILREAHLATVLMDLLTPEEGVADAETVRYRFDIGFLAERLGKATDWLAQLPELRDLPIGYFGASTGAAAALVAAAERPTLIRAVVSRGGRPDLASLALPYVQAPTLLIVGGDDLPVIELNKQALRSMRCETKLSIVPGATHLFEEPGTLAEAARMARQWFSDHLVGMMNFESKV